MITYGPCGKSVASGEKRPGPGEMFQHRVGRLCVRFGIVPELFAERFAINPQNGCRTALVAADRVEHLSNVFALHGGKRAEGRRTACRCEAHERRQIGCIYRITISHEYETLDHVF